MIKKMIKKHFDVSKVTKKVLYLPKIMEENSVLP